MVSYAEEVIDFQECCQFRTEIDILPSQPTQNCYMNIEVFFLEESSSNSLDILPKDFVFLLISLELRHQ